MPLALSVVTPEGQAFEGKVDSVVLPGALGRFGVLPGHEVFLSALENGEMSIEADGKRTHAALSRGFAEVHEDAVTVMVGRCEFAHEIDQDRARIAADRARAQLEKLRGHEGDHAEYQKQREKYARAVARVSVGKKK